MGIKIKTHHIRFCIISKNKSEVYHDKFYDNIKLFLLILSVATLILGVTTG